MVDVWRRPTSPRGEFNKNISIGSGNGQKLMVWEDSWDGLGLLKEQVPCLYSMVNNTCSNFWCIQWNWLELPV